MEPTAQRGFAATHGTVAARRIPRVLFLGVPASGGTLPTQIARAVWPKKPIRTAVNLLRRYWVDSWVPMDRVRLLHLRQQAGKLDADARVHIDPSDAAKPCARVLEHLAWVRDAGLDRIVKGCWTLHAVALDGAACRVGLPAEIFSVENPDTPRFPGLPHSCLPALHESPGAPGIFVMDQGPSSDEIIETFSGWMRRFVLRIVDGRRICDEKEGDLGILARLRGFGTLRPSGLYA